MLPYIFFLCLPPLGAFAAIQEVRQEFLVAGPPAPGTCSLTPDEDPPTGYSTTFVFECKGWTDPQDGRLVYALAYSAPEEEGEPLHLVYRGTRPNASNLVIPSGEHSYKAIV